MLVKYDIFSFDISMNDTVAVKELESDYNVGNDELRLVLSELFLLLVKVIAEVTTLDIFSRQVTV